jgi:hypothetical protein
MKNQSTNNPAKPKFQLGNLKVNRITVTATLLAFGWLMFEVFNFASTEFALNDALGNLEFGGIRWATILALAFCMIDFAGIARIFTPEQGRDEPVEVWYLFGAWLLAAAMNATLTWWAVTVAISKHPPEAASVVGSEITQVVPVFVAIMVWIVRILIIGTFAMVGEQFFTAEPGPYHVRIHRLGQQPTLGDNSRQISGYTPAYRLPGESRPSTPPQQEKQYNPSPRPAYRPIQENHGLPPGALGDLDEFDEV